MLRRWRAAWLWRRRRFDPPWTQGPPPPFLDQAGSRPRWAPLIRRRRRFDPPWAPPAFVPRLLAAHRPPALRVRRGRFTAPPWAQVVQQPSVWPPAAVVARRRAPALPRIHGRRFDPPWPFIPPPALTWGTSTAAHEQVGAGVVAFGGPSGTTTVTDAASATVSTGGATSAAVHQQAFTGEGQVQ